MASFIQGNLYQEKQAARTPLMGQAAQFIRCKCNFPQRPFLKNVERRSGLIRCNCFTSSLMFASFRHQSQLVFRFRSRNQSGPACARGRVRGGLVCIWPAAIERGKAWQKRSRCCYMRVTVAAENQRSEVTHAGQPVLLFHVTSEGAEMVHQGPDLV